MRHFFRSQIVFAVIWCGCLSAFGEEPDSSADKKTARQAEIRQHMHDLTMELVSNTDFRPVAMIDHALLTYTDPARGNDDGTVWGWGTKGRPLALVEVYRATAESQWIHAVTQTSTGQVILSVSGTPMWSPQRSAIEFQMISQAPQVADREVTRLGQLKDLARKFDAHEFWDPDNSRFELRLLVQPIHRYSDPEHQIVDGAVFLMAHGTNPEIAILIEAQGDSADAAEWRFGIARLGSAELHVGHNGNEVWQAKRTPGVTGKPNDPYWLFVTQPKPTKQ